MGKRRRERVKWVRTVEKGFYKGVRVGEKGLKG